MEEKNYFFSVDAETDGLWGVPFAIGAVVYNNKGEEIDTFYFLSNKEIKNSWVQENVVPHLGEQQGTQTEMLEAFGKFYLRYKDVSETCWHMGHVVEAYLFRLLVEKNIIGQWDAPYCPIEISEHLRIAGENPDSVDKFLEKNKITVDGETHNPLYDARVAATALFLLKKKN